MFFIIWTKLPAAMSQFSSIELGWVAGIGFWILKDLKFSCWDYKNQAEKNLKGPCIVVGSGFIIEAVTWDEPEMINIVDLETIKASKEVFTDVWII